MKYATFSTQGYKYNHRVGLVRGHGAILKENMKIIAWAGLALVAGYAIMGGLWITS